ncbi:2-C-methyl-D-erythritol 2,4-cyclodiphosphate synthase [Maricaulis maris]|uniref:Bifunctional enzyme IspD/IspF n=2 Tax=Maricaulis maris TaxID=74318 RepID=A0A495DM40_9PROT|nr:bifunctional 2-C-methyl-D-erythritol 4-phosphate cytidylyltransferase/2-C-methyl-D-erythritol 2,4-cyclodiphosphate synthase [Maricaulis maris]RKR02796.1 2-C-methyl-D-erythritol 2,4-cyclodiphosphate synthase [Maricaulis maris]
MKIAAVIVAAGRGERAGGGVPKQYRELAGKSVLSRTLHRLRHGRVFVGIIVVINPADQDHITAVEAELGTKLDTIPGGATRTASVRAGLEAARATGADAVLIHDAARPFVSHKLIDRLVDALATHDAVIPALPVADALFRSAGDDGTTMGDPVSRDGLFAAQTPQAFHLAPLLAAYAQLGDTALPDDAAVIRAAGGEVALVPGEAENFKLTTADDFDRAERQIMSETITVTGQGYDVHRLEPAEVMWLCGIEIRAGLGLIGHSDADAGLHALTDAILGAAGAGDIGQHFPPSDPQWKGAASDAFLLHAVKLLKDAGGELVHADLTIIAERPKIGPHREAMRARVAQLLGLPEARVNIKATTTEKLGFTGRGEGLAAQAIVTARLTA